MSAKAKPAAGKLRPTQLYDVAILGPGLGGLVAGALLAQRGHRVLHVAPPTPHWTSGGFRLPHAPQLLPQLKSIPAVKETLEELSLTTAIHRSLEPVSLGVLLPRARLELPHDEAARGRELARALPGAADPLPRLAALAEGAAGVIAARPLPPDGAIESWRVNRLARGLADLQPFTSGESPLPLLDLHRFISNGPPTALGFARSSGWLGNGIYRLPTGLVPALRSSLAHHRGELLDGVQAEGLVLERGAFAGLHLAGGESPFRARVLIYAGSAGELTALLPGGRLRNRQEELAAAAPPAGALVTRNLVVREEGLPPGLGSLSLASGFEGGPLLLEVAATIRADGAADPLLRTVTASAFAPVETIDRLLSELLPFHEGHVEHRAAPPDPGHPLFESKGPLGVEGVKLRGAAGRVIHAGPDLLPGLGLEGAFLAGRRAAALAQEICRKVKALS